LVVHACYTQRRSERRLSATIQFLSVNRSSVPDTRGLAALEGIPSPATDALRRRLLERELADNATRHAKREIPTDLYLAEHARISPELDALETSPSVSPAVDAEDAVAALRNLAAAWRNASEEAQAQL